MFAAPGRVINLMEALRRSVAQDHKPTALPKGAPVRKRAAVGPRSEQGSHGR
jgi:non-homologous end joining protein Ku